MTHSAIAAVHYSPEVPKVTVDPITPLASRVQAILAAASQIKPDRDTFEIACPDCGGRVKGRFAMGNLHGRCVTKPRCYAFVL